MIKANSEFQVLEAWFYLFWLTGQWIFMDGKALL